MSELLESLLLLELHISFPALLAALIGMLLLSSACMRLWQRRLVTAGLTGSLGLALICGAVAVLLLALNIHTYQRLTYERPVAVISFDELGPKEYRATLSYPDGKRVEAYQLRGDEWQLDARVLRWEPLLQLLGFNAVYRLERLGGRYRAIEEERSQPRTVYSLAREQGLDLWSLAHQYPRWLGWLDAYYGSATYLPIQDRARYIVSITQSGLIARPENVPAAEALSTWR